MARRDAGAALERADLVFDAISHGARRQILLVILYRGGRMTSGEIADRFSCEWATTSHHLAILQKAGLVRVRRKGRQRLYRLVPRRLLQVIQDFAVLFERRSGRTSRRRPY